MISAARRPVAVPWAITFADLALLLLCFFVMLTAQRQAQTTLADAGVDLALSPALELSDALQKKFAAEIADGWLKVDARTGSLHVQFGASDGFESGSDNLATRTLTLIDAMGSLLSREDVTITVIGHTDNVPISTERFRDNWELSSARAISVIRELIRRHGVDPRRLEAKGYADTHPLYSNDSESNRLRNRRIEIEISWAR